MWRWCFCNFGFCLNEQTRLHSQWLLTVTCHLVTVLIFFFLSFFLSLFLSFILPFFLSFFHFVTYLFFLYFFFSFILLHYSLSFTFFYLLSIFFLSFFLRFCICVLTTKIQSLAQFKNYLFLSQHNLSLSLSIPLFLKMRKTTNVCMGDSKRRFCFYSTIFGLKWKVGFG